MTVYVDDMRRRARVGWITANWSHLMADSPTELREFAQRLGLRPEWIQHAGTHREHFDVTDSHRTKALKLGAQPLSYPRETGQHLVDKRAAYGVRSLQAAAMLICEPAKDCKDPHINRWHCERGHALDDQPAVPGVCLLKVCEQRGANR